MKTAPTLLALFAGALVLPVASHAAQLMINGNFETPVTPDTTTDNADNLGVVPPNWTFAASNVANPTNVPADANTARGTITGTQAPVHIGNTTLTSYVDGSTTHDRSIDGNGGTIVYISQQFTLTVASTLSVSAAFGGRDYTSANAGNGSNWTIGRSTTPATALASGTTTLPTFGAWAVDSGTTGVFAPGTYQMTIALADPDEVDAVSVVSTAVPEPSTLVATLGGLGLLGLAVRRSRVC